MNKRIILALTGAALLIAASAVSVSPSFSSAQAQSQNNNTGTQGFTSPTISNGTITASNVTLQLHAQLDAAIVAAQNNDTLGALTSLSQIIEGLTAINDPSSTAAELAATSNPETTTSSNQTSSTTDNQTRTTNSSNTTTSGGIGTDNPESGSDNPYSDFT